MGMISDRAAVVFALVVVAASSSSSAAAPLSVAIGPGVTVDWQRGLVISTAVGPADRNAPSPTVARAAAARLAERLARARLAAAIASVPTVGAPAADALARELAAAPVLTVGYGTDGSVRIAIGLGVEAVRQAIDGPRPVRGDDGAPSPVVIDARALAVAPQIGLGLVAGTARWRGPVRYVAALPALPDGARPVVATGLAAGALTIAGPLPDPGASVVVVVPTDP